MDMPGWFIPAITIGPLIGLAGGIYGTYSSISRAKSAAERRLMVRFAVGCWLAVVLLLGLPLGLVLTGIIPEWVRWPPFFIFFGLLGPTAKWVGRRQETLRNRVVTEDAPTG
jgi:hypothetical protein